MTNQSASSTMPGKNYKLFAVIAMIFICLCLLMVTVACAGWQLFSPTTPRGSYSLTLINETGEDICSLTIKVASSHTRFGSDQLRGTLKPGESFTITGLAEGYYDVRAGRCADPSDWYRRDDIPVLSDNASWTFR